MAKKDEKCANVGNSVLACVKRIKTRRRALLFDERPLSLPAMIASAGIERVTDQTSYDWHGLKRGRAKFVLWQYTLSGAGRLRYEDHTTTVRAGQAMILRFPHDNRYWFESDGKRASHWRFFYICLHGREVRRIWQWAMDQAGPLLSLNENDEVLTTAASTFRQIIRDEITSPLQASAAAYDLACQLADHVRQRNRVKGQMDGLATKPLSNASPSDRALRQAIRYIQQHLDQPLSVEQLADQVGMSRFHFSRLFKAALGISPIDFLQRERLRQAAALLHETELPIKQVARQCGYADPNYLAKAFRKMYDVSPSAMRNSGMY